MAVPIKKGRVFYPQFTWERASVLRGIGKARGQYAETDLSPGTFSPPISRRTVTAYRALDATLVLIIAASVLWFLDRTDRIWPTSQGPVASDAMSIPLPLSSDPLDPAVTTDIATVSELRNAVEAQLAEIDTRPLNSHGNQADQNRRATLLSILSNAGGSGLNDRLAEIQQAIRRRNMEEERNFVRQAIRDIHATAESCRSGPFADAAKPAGLHSAPESRN